MSKQGGGGNKNSVHHLIVLVSSSMQASIRLAHLVVEMDYKGEDR